MQDSTCTSTGTSSIILYSRMILILFLCCYLSCGRGASNSKQFSVSLVLVLVLVLVLMVGRGLLTRSGLVRFSDKKSWSGAL